MKAQEITRQHPVSGKELLRGERQISLKFRGHEATVAMPGWYAADDLSGDDGLHDPADMKVSDRALNMLKAKAAGLLIAPEVRKIRKDLKLSQQDAGTIIGGGPRAFQKYEIGDILISKAVDSVLRLLSRDPSRLEELREVDRGAKRA